MALHIPGVDLSYKNPYTGKWYNIHMFLYDFALFLFEIAFTIFFREVQVRGSANVPPKGNPAILVCAPHANQFIDPTLVMAELSKLPGRRSRRVRFVTAAVSISKPLVGIFAKWTGSIPIERATDNFQDVDTNMQLYCPDYDNNPLLYKTRARDPNIPVPDLRELFTSKSLVGLPNYLSNAQIDSIPEADTLLLVKPFRNTPQVKDLVTRGTNFKYAAKVDNTSVFQNVFNHLHTKGMVGIFPEGGSHDRPSLLPIKAGVAIMALGAVAVDPSMPIRILPCGLNYFHRHKFRSRAVIEFGEPIIVDGSEGERYIQDPRTAVSDLLERITQALYSVTINAADYDTLMLIQATRRLYQPRPNDGRTSLSEVVEMNRRLLTGYTKCKDDPRVKALMKDVHEYNSTLYSLGLRDHQVDKLKSSNETIWHTLRMFLLRLFQLLTFVVLALPGAILFSPIFITCHYFSQKKAREALRRSFVKIKGDDLLATWKLFVALCMGPTLYITYSLVLTFLSYKYLGYTSISDLLKGFIYYYAILLATTYASFRIGERGVDIFKSLPPLFISLIYPSRKIDELKNMRKKLSNAVTDVITTLGPVFFPDMEVHEKCQDVDDNSDVDLNSDEMPSESRSSSCLSDSLSSQASNAISKINSRGSLTDIPILGEDVNIVQTELMDEEFEYVGFPSSKISNMVIKNRTHKDKYD